MGAPEIYMLWHFTGKYEYVMALPIIIFIAIVNIALFLDPTIPSVCLATVVIIDAAVVITAAYYFLTREKPVKRKVEPRKAK
ncbi:MAG: hypothetical protein JSW28_02160 [Thermoplasmata archaeon]|nr:MAG: hypothetical protein JSW28_02160 [Thermoplasmata archaeon]